ncbi:10351_t:CDS:2, partial [Cetraspora pellucida]
DSSISMTESETSNDHPQKRNKQGGPVFNEVWDYVIKHEKVPKDICQYWRNKLIDVDNAYKRNSQLQLALSSQVSDKILLRAWIMTNNPFEVIENPYIKDLFKRLNPV